MQKTVKINIKTYEILKKIKEVYKVPISSSIDLAVKEYSKNKKI